MPRSVPIVEVHSHDTGMRRVDEFCQMIQWSYGVDMPWDTIQLNLKLPRDRWKRLAPSLGDWIVLRDRETGRARSFGYVAARNTSITVNGPRIVVQPVQIQAISWMALLGRMQTYVSPGIGSTFSKTEIALGAERGRNATTGTLMSARQWADAKDGPWQALKAAAGLIGKPASGANRRDVGFALAVFVEKIARLWFPPTLSGATIAQMVRVVHDKSTRDAYAPGRVVDPVRGATLAGISQILPMGATVLSLIMGTWMSDTNMMELFPSLEREGVPSLSGDPRDVYKRNPTEIALEAARRASGTVRPVGLDGGKGRDAVTGDRTKRRDPSSTRPPRLVTPLAQSVGQNVVMVYRMKPWRDVELAQFLSGDPFKKIRDRSLVKVDTSRIDPAMFDGVTWDARNAQAIDINSVYSIGLSANDEEHVNTVTTGLPTQADHAVRLMEKVGLPMYSSSAIQRRGVRLYQPQWPFFPPYDSSAAATKQVPSFFRGVYTVAALGSQYMSGADRFERGEIVCEYLPQLRHGKVTKVDIPAGFPGDDRLTCYADAVQNTFSVSGSNIVARTVVRYSRGLLEEAARSVPFGDHGVGGTR